MKELYKIYKTAFLISLSLIIVTNAYSQYSDASFNGAWMFFISDSGQVEGQSIIFDGNGVIIDFSSFDDDNHPEGTYSVSSDGSYTGNLYGSMDMTGQLTSATEATITVTAGIEVMGPYTMNKVSNEAICQGSWEGVLTEDNTGAVTNINVEIESDGSISSLTGLTGPVTGYFLSNQGLFKSHMNTGETTSWSQVSLNGQLSGEIITGTYGLDCGGCDGGQFTMTRTGGGQSIETVKVPQVLNVSCFPNPFHAETVIKYTLNKSVNVDISVYDMIGNKIRILSKSIQNRGTYELKWDGLDDKGAGVSKGIYFVHMQTDTGVITERLIKK